jgi:hypothetical protein
MSIDAVRICCTGCDFEALETFASTGVVYRLSEGKEIRSYPLRFGWCYRCDGYRQIENMDADRFRRQLNSNRRARARCERRLNDLSKRFLGGLRSRSERRRFRSKRDELDSTIHKLEEWLQIATTRRSSPKCLVCWSEQTAPVSIRWPTPGVLAFKHKCGGNLRVVDAGVRMHYRGIAMVALTSEGDLLERWNKTF